MIQSMESIHPTFASESSDPQNHTLVTDGSQSEQEEKSRLISQVLELQNTLHDLSLKVDCVKDENLSLKSENQVLCQYIDKLKSEISAFQSTSSNTRKNKDDS